MSRYDQEPLTPLRRRFIDDLRLRNQSPRTIETYVLRVALFARHFGRAPDLLGPDEIRAYQQHLLAKQVSWSQFHQAVCALRFLYQVTLGRSEIIRHLPFAKRPRTLPVVLSPEEVVARSSRRGAPRVKSRKNRAQPPPWSSPPTSSPARRERTEGIESKVTGSTVSRLSPSCPSCRRRDACRRERTSRTGPRRCA